MHSNSVGIKNQSQMLMVISPDPLIVGTHALYYKPPVTKGSSWLCKANNNCFSSGKAYYKACFKVQKNWTSFFI